MALSKLTTDLNNIQALSDRPNALDGLTADELKEKFDEAGNEIKTYINDILTPEQDTINTNLSSGWLSGLGTWTYASADAPTFVANTSVDLAECISPGTRIKLTQTTEKYFIVTAITSSTITLYGGTDYTLANAAITLPYFSSAKAPCGFPISPAKWSVTSTIAAFSQTDPGTTNYYNIADIVFPIGVWNLNYNLVDRISNGATVTDKVLLAYFSEANNGLTNSILVQRLGAYGNLYVDGSTSGVLIYTYTTKKTVYLLLKCAAIASPAGSINAYGNTLTAVCAYL